MKIFNNIINTTNEIRNIFIKEEKKKKKNKKYKKK